MTALTWLVADAGATNLRVALCGPAVEGLHARRVLRCADFATLGDALESYLRETGARPRQASLAVAGPVGGDEFRFTNNAWMFSRERLAARFGLERLLVLNDFEALAMALPHLPAAQLQTVGGGAPEPGCAKAVLGPGSGLGVALLVPDSVAPGRWIAVPGEGGHTGFAPADEIEDDILRVLRAEHGHVSNEALLSGPGLARLYAALARLAGQDAVPLEAAQVSVRALEGSDALAVRALDVFFAVLGSVAGDIALVGGARGGVYVGGGIVPRMTGAMRASRFRARFEDKGAQRGYVSGIATAVIADTAPALMGARAALLAPASASA